MAAPESAAVPEFIATRLQVFERIRAECQERLSKLPKEPIHVTLPDGTVVDGVSYENSAYDILKKAKQAKGVVAVKVDGELYHITKPLEKSCKLETFTFEDDIGREVFWHSSAHILGATLEELYEASLGVGPAIEKGFYYDASLKGNKVLTTDDYPIIEKRAKSIAQKAGEFVELDVTKEQALELFSYNKYKVELITEKVADGDMCRVFKCGSFIDFCRGPHVPSTTLLSQAYLIRNSAAAYWKGDANNDSMQRVYGIAFPDKKALNEWEEKMKQMKARKHTRIGTDQELFLAHPLAPGCPLFLPHGVRIYRTLENLIRDKYWKYGYQEVMTPTFYNVNLWEISGHWQHYKDNMYSFKPEGEDAVYGLKPMNCPGHCLIFKSKPHSIHELPLRLADFGEIHRNELTGALRGLTRVRRFHQDDAHIFCAKSQISQEISNVLKFIDEVYGIFGFKYKLGLSTRPLKGSIGSDENWEAAEAALTDALDKFGQPYTINPGDGAFYGPKIDIALTDALGRDHQCATCQLDFNLPERFELSYMDSTGKLERPVMIHRAILGSLERFMAVLTEHTAGVWPFWVSPRQVYVTVLKDANTPEYREKYIDKFWERIHFTNKFFSCLDEAPLNLSAASKKAMNEKWTVFVVIGVKDAEQSLVSYRIRSDKGYSPTKQANWEEFCTMLETMVKEHK